MITLITGTYAAYLASNEYCMTIKSEKYICNFNDKCEVNNRFSFLDNLTAMRCQDDIGYQTVIHSLYPKIYTNLTYILGKCLCAIDNNIVNDLRLLACSGTAREFCVRNEYGIITTTWGPFSVNSLYIIALMTTALIPLPRAFGITMRST